MGKNETTSSFSQKSGRGVSSLCFLIFGHKKGILFDSQSRLRLTLSLGDPCFAWASPTRFWRRWMTFILRGLPIVFRQPRTAEHKIKDFTFGIPDSFVRASRLRTFRLQCKAARLVTWLLNMHNRLVKGWCSHHSEPGSLSDFRSQGFAGISLLRTRTPSVLVQFDSGSARSSFFLNSPLAVLSPDEECVEPFSEGE